MIRRLLADANLNAAIATGLVRNNSEIDFQRAEDVPLKGLPTKLFWLRRLNKAEFWSVTTSVPFQPTCGISSVKTTARE
jgi:hypothetical protein